MKFARLLPFTAALAVSTVRADFRAGQQADLVIGVPGAAGVLSAADIAVDAATQKVFVADAVRHRVLRFTSQASLQNGGLAEAVFGAADMEDVAPGTSATALRAPQGLCVDAAGRLWVADTENNRVLRFDNAVNGPSGAAAAGVLGQADFTSSSASLGSTRMNGPQDVEVDSSGRLWVADTLNNRVLRFEAAATRPSGAAADGVLGQSGGGTGAAGTTQSTFSGPTGLAAESANGNTTRLWVADRSNSRVVGFDNPAGKANGPTADKLLGQTDWSVSASALGANRLARPSKVALDGTGLWVSDTDHHRVVLFAAANSKPLGANADIVLGQATSTGVLYGVTDATYLYIPTGLAAAAGRVWVGDSGQRVVRHDAAAGKATGAPADGVLGRLSLAPGSVAYAADLVVEPTTGKLFVTDSANNRVLRFASTAALDANTAPEAVFGQPDFSSRVASVSATKLNNPGAINIDALGNLWVCDAGNSRVLRFANAVTAPSGAAAAQVLGQPDFTSRNTDFTAANSIGYPSAVVAEWAFTQTFQVVIRRLWVADSDARRVLRFENPLGLANGADASGVLGAANLSIPGSGQATATSFGRPSALAVDLNGRLWVADGGHSRILRFESAASKANGAAADGVLLQPNFTSTSPTAEFGVTDLLLGANNRLYAVRPGQSDLVWFDNAAAKANGTAPDGTLGGPGRIHGAPGSCAALDPSGRLWTGNGFNLLRFTPTLESRILKGTLVSPNQFQLEIFGRAGETFFIRSSTDLQNWSTSDSAVTPSNTGLIIMFTPISGPQKYYRLEEQ